MAKKEYTAPKADEPEVLPGSPYDDAAESEEQPPAANAEPLGGLEDDDDNAYVPAIRRGGNALASAEPQLIDMTGIPPPWLAIAHGVGGLAEKGFNPGSLVLAGEHLLVEKGLPLNIIILKFEQYWKQYMNGDDFAAGLRPQLFPNKEAAQAAGLRTEWTQDGQGPEVSPAMDWSLLIEKPKDCVCGMFGLTIDGVEYALANMSIDKQAYRAVAPVLLPAARYSLSQRGIFSAKWAMKTVFVKSKKTGNGAWVPNITLVGYNKDEFITAAKAALS